MKLVDVEQIYCSDCEHKGHCENVTCDIKTMPTVDPVVWVLLPGVQALSRWNGLVRPTIIFSDLGRGTLFSG